jgi:formamidopyrimidine-DNA glycosylase
VRILRSDYLRGQTPKKFVSSVEGKTIERITRRGKYLLWIFQDAVMLSHLGMTGKYIVQTNAEDIPKHTVAIFNFESAVLIFQDVRRFGRLYYYRQGEVIPEIANLGPEPFSPEFKASRLSKLFAHRKRAIKELLLDQSIVAGIGNIYASEILFQAKIHPAKAGQDLNLKELRRIVIVTREILNTAITKAGTTISDYRRIDNKSGEFQHFLKVYGREGFPCLQCNTVIVRIRQSNRSSFYCPQCQAL